MAMDFFRRIFVKFWGVGQIRQILTRVFLSVALETVVVIDKLFRHFPTPLLSDESNGRSRLHPAGGLQQHR